jgi:hypothetical protein
MRQSILRPETQYSKAGISEEKIWITYLEESIEKLQEVSGLVIPTADRISVLADRYRERLYEDLTD